MEQFIWKETEIELHPNSINKEDGLDLKEAMYTSHSLLQRAQQTSPKWLRCSQPFSGPKAVSSFYICLLFPFSVSVLYPQPLVPPSRHLMIPCTLTLLSHSLSPFTCIQSWPLPGPLYYIIFIQFIINHTHFKLCLIWTHQLACYCSESSSIIVHLRIPLFSTTSGHPGPPTPHPIDLLPLPAIHYWNHYSHMCITILPSYWPFFWTAWSRIWRHYVPWKLWEPLIQWQCHISLALLKDLNLSAVKCCDMLMFEHSYYWRCKWNNIKALREVLFITGDCRWGGGGS